MKIKIFFWSITVALAGFLFGFDTIVISGAEQTLQELWKDYTLFGSNDNFHGYIVVGSALFGTIFGALFGGLPTNKLGRKNTLIWIGIFYTVSALGSGLSNDPWLFAFFRFLGGLGVGASTIAAPAYIAEIASPKNRGKLVASYQFNIVFGILVAFVSNYLISTYVVSENAWRWMIGIEAVPAMIYTLMVMGVPKSPRWLLIKDRKEEALKVIALINPEIDPNVAIAKIMEAESGHSKETVFQKKYKRIILLAFAIAFFNQFSGINAFLYYSKRIFEEAGLANQAALLGSIGIGVANLIFTLLGMYLIDRLGRRKLMIIGSIGYIASLTFVALAFFNGWTGMIVPISLFVFIGAHAIGQGAVIWVYISEIFPNHVRSYGQSIGTSTHWILAFIIPSSVPLLIAKIGAGSMFLFFAIMMVFQFIWVLFVMPETKGVSLEDLEKQLVPNEE
ncbi:MAG: MFS transporter [Flavobacteriaceae bacterium]|nr:MFS transporter [Flavobacteriaceae bacterium]|tara:strand:- start:194567 stop:195913 length:1347 start_codon:yes stop_codon:yes gene_type:complete